MDRNWAADKVWVIATKTQNPLVRQDRNPSADGRIRLLGRQPILDADLSTFGQEVILGNGSDDGFSGTSDEHTRQMIDSLLVAGPASILSGGKIFVSCTRSSLLQGLATLLPTASTVLEISSTMDVDAEVVGACKKLRELGYEFALEDYSPHVDVDQLLPFASYLKLDARSSNAKKLAALARHIGAPGLSYIAKHIETQAEFTEALSAGFVYFQGYFFARPILLEQHDLPPNKAIYLQLLSTICRSPFDRLEVERLVMAEASLCFRLLRLLNSTGMGVRNTIRTVRHAMMMIGDDELSKLIMVSGAAALAANGKASEELLLMVQYRARFCELLAAPTRQISGEQYLIGLLSVIEALLLLPIARVLEMLPLRAEAKAALMGDFGPVALPLRLLEAYERKDWDLCAQLGGGVNVSKQQVEHYYLASLRWGAQQSRAMKT